MYTGFSSMGGSATSSVFGSNDSIGSGNGNGNGGGNGNGNGGGGYGMVSSNGVVSSKLDPRVNRERIVTTS